jgi:hypothetical protein
VEEPLTARMQERQRATRRSTSAAEPYHVAFTLQITEEQIDELQAQQALLDPIAFKAKPEPDTLYYHEAMKVDDREQFTDTMGLEIDADSDNEHWELVKREDVPKHHKILSAVWAMKRKRRIATGEIYKWKADINICGGQQIYGFYYDETFSQWSVGHQSGLPSYKVRPISGAPARLTSFLLFHELT